jgi:hypothetical protein
MSKQRPDYTAVHLRRSRLIVCGLHAAVVLHKVIHLTNVEDLRYSKTERRKQTSVFRLPACKRSRFLLETNCPTSVKVCRCSVRQR